MIFGKKIKELREERGQLQRHLCAALEIDTPMYSKIERGERKAKRSQIPIMAKLFEVDEKELLTIWLADKVLDTVAGEDEIMSDAILYAQTVINSHKQFWVKVWAFADSFVTLQPARVFFGFV